MKKLKSIKGLMIICFSAVVIVGMLFTGEIFYQKFNSAARNYADMSREQVLTQVQYSLETYIGNILEISNALVDQVMKRQEINKDNLVTQMKAIEQINPYISSLAVFKDTGELVVSTHQCKMPRKSEVQEQDWFINAIKEQEVVHFSTAHQQKIFSERAPWVISLSRSVSWYEKGRRIQGVLLIDSNLNGIKDICQLISQREMGRIYIATPNGEMIYGDGNVILGNEEGDRNLRTIKRMTYTGWEIVGIWQPQQGFVAWNEINELFIFILIIAVVICILIAIVITSKVSSPLYKRQKSMLLVKQEDSDIQLGDSIQSSVNIDFLYNTLDTLTSLVKKEKFEQIIVMTTALSKFYRIENNSDKGVITVAEEIEHARNYLQVQEINYNNKFEFEIEVEEQVLEAPTIKFILQPLLENAIEHDIQPIHYEGLIRLRVWQEEEDLIYNIYDNGKGMSAEMQERFLEEETKIRTMNQRIKRYYGSDYGMWIEGELEEGTAVYIKIPLQ